MSLIAGFEHIVRENEPLAPFTRLNLGGVAEFFAEPTNLEELVGLVISFSAKKLPIRLIGGGSNILVRDEGVPGLVLHLTAPAQKVSIFTSLSCTRPYGQHRFRT